MICVAASACKSVVSNALICDAFSAAIWVVLSAATSVVVKATIAVVRRPAICRVVRLPIVVTFEVSGVEDCRAGAT